MSRRDRVEEYEEREYSRGPPRGAPVRLAERPAPTRMRGQDLDDLLRQQPVEDRQVGYVREDYRRTEEQQPLVLRKRELETYQRPIRRERSPSIERVRTREVVRERERSPSPPPVQVRYTERERERVRSPSRERTTVRIDRERVREPAPEVYRERYVERERARSPSPVYDRERVRTRTYERERERSPSPLYDRERISTTVVDRERRRSPSSSSSASSVRVPVEPPIIRAPPIHQEVVTHHRHIDHGFEYQPQYVTRPAPTPPPPRRARSPSPLPPPPVRSREEVRETEIDIHTGRGHTDIEIYKRDQERERPRNNRDFYDDDVLFEREREHDRLRARTDIRRSVSQVRSSRGIRPFESEEDYYARKTDERAYIGEAYNGATKKWEIVDVPPGTERVTMDGVGGGRQEITWQKYNGVRRSRFTPQREPDRLMDRESERETSREIVRDVAPRDSGYDRSYEKIEINVNAGDDRRVGRPLPPPGPPTRRNRDIWTEITKDLVIREAVEELGYDYEETEFFFYVFRYLDYNDVVQLVDLSADISKARRRRIREIEWEKEHPRRRRGDTLTIEASSRRNPPPDEEERIIEREIIYDNSSRRKSRVYY